MGSRLRGNDGRAAAHPTIVIPTTAGIHGSHIGHSRDGGNPRRGAGDGFPSPRERRTAAAHPTIVVPTTAGIHGSHIGHSRDGGNPRRGAGDGFPSPRERRTAAAHPTIHLPATAGRGAPTIVIPTTAGIHGSHIGHSRDGGNPRRGGRRWVPVSTGTTDGGGAPHNRHSRDGGNPSLTWCTITTPEAVRHAVLPSQLVNLGRIGVVLAGCLPYA